MNVILFICSLVSSFILAEATVRIIAPQNLSGSWRTKSPAGLSVNKSEGSAQHQLDGRVIYYRFYPPHLRDTELNNEEYTVLALGESFTFGWLLNKNGTFIDRLQTLMDIEFGDHTFNVVNAAAGGWGTADYVAYVEEFGEIVSPDVIIIFMNTDDIGRSLKSPLYSFKDRASLLLKRNRVEPGALKKLTEFLPFYEWSLENLHSLQLLRRAYLTPGSGHVPAGKDGGRSPPDLVPHSGNLDAVQIGEAVDLAKALFLRLKRWADENGSELYVTTTGWHQPPYDRGPPEPTRAFMAVAERFFDEADIPYDDVSPDVLRTRMRAPESFIIPNDGHPNERGSELIARAAWPFIRKKLHEFCARRPAEAKVATGDEADRDDGGATLVRTGGAAGRCLQPDHADR